MSNSNEILVIADCGQGTVSSFARELLAAGRVLANKRGAQVHFLPLGADAKMLAAEAAAAGADKISYCSQAVTKGYQPELFAKIGCAAIRHLSPAVTLLSHAAMGRDLAPRLAFALGIRWAGGCVAVDISDGGIVCVRSEVGGKVVVTERVTAPSVVTLRPKCFDIMPTDNTRSAEIVDIVLDEAMAMAGSSIAFVERQPNEGGAAAELEKAEVIVSGGLGIGSAKAFEKLKAIACALGGVVGASKQAVDRGWIESDRQVGLTGTIVAPKLYLAIGISGAPQHIAGCQKSKVIVAINTDRDAPIFSYAKYGVIGDWEQVVGELTKALS